MYLFKKKKRNKKFNQTINQKNYLCDKKRKKYI